MKKVKRYEGKASSIPAASVQSDEDSSREDHLFIDSSNVTTIATAAVSSPKATADDSFLSTSSAHGLTAAGFDDADFDLYHIEIPPEIVPTNDIEDMVRIAANGKVSEKNRLVANLTEFSFSYTIENLPSHQSRAPLDQIWYEAGLKFDEVLITLPTDPVWQERLFKYFPNQTWPKEFLDYIQELKDKRPSQTWLNKTPRVMERNPQEQQITYFGNLLRDRYLTVRNFIKWHLAKKWRDPEELPPGWNLHKLLYAIRKSLWPAECRRRFIETASRKARRSKLDEDATRKLLDERKEMKRWDPNWYPSQWLSFLFLNPGPSKHIDFMFTASSAAVNNTSGSGAAGHYLAYPSYPSLAGEDDDDSEDEANQDSKPKGSRKRPAALMAKSLVPSSIPITAGGTLLDPADEKKRRDCEVSIRALERKLAILTRQGRPEEEIRSVENDLLECLSIQASCYKKYRPNNEGI